MSLSELAANDAARFLYRLHNVPSKVLQNLTQLNLTPTDIQQLPGDIVSVVNVSIG